MTENHPGYRDIQIYVFDPEACDIQVAAHIANCPKCQAEAGSYALLASNLEKIDRADFEFNLADAVTAGLAATKRQRRSPGAAEIIGWILLSATLLSIAWVAIRIFLTISPLPVIKAGLAGACLVVCFIFLFASQLMSYRRKLKLIAQ